MLRPADRPGCLTDWLTILVGRLTDAGQPTIHKITHTHTHTHTRTHMHTHAHTLSHRHTYIVTHTQFGGWYVSEWACGAKSSKCSQQNKHFEDGSRGLSERERERRKRERERARAFLHKRRVYSEIALRLYLSAVLPHKQTVAYVEQFFPLAARGERCMIYNSIPFFSLSAAARQNRFNSVWESEAHIQRLIEANWNAKWGIAVLLT